MFKNMQGAKETSYETGVKAEELAAKKFRKDGYKILEQRYKTRYGEIDLIVRKGDSLVFVEVKARRDMTDSLYAITPKTRRRIEQAALFYLSEHPELSDLSMRFDVIAICVKDGGISLEHLDNAWIQGA